MADEQPPEEFSSRLGLILTTVGAAVGTGTFGDSLVKQQQMEGELS